ncbi:MAG: hypothetical protein ABSH08_10725, partial [Tepidisphaeraceae bacterium]
KPCKNGVRQVHGHEVDIVAARSDSLILASVKSFFGSGGVSKQGFNGIADSKRRRHLNRYAMFNQRRVRNGILKAASERYGYPKDKIQFALFCGKFRACDEAVIRRHLEAMNVGAGSVEVIGPEQIAERIIEFPKSHTYINDPVLATLKLLERTHYLRGTTGIN